MKISEVINRLDEFEELYGDLDVAIHNESSEWYGTGMLNGPESIMLLTEVDDDKRKVVAFNFDAIKKFAKQGHVH